MGALSLVQNLPLNLQPPLPPNNTHTHTHTTEQTPAKNVDVLVYSSPLNTK